jgi:chromosome segregation ATPase
MGKNIKEQPACLCGGDMHCPYLAKLLDETEEELATLREENEEHVQTIARLKQNNQAMGEAQGDLISERDGYKKEFDRLRRELEGARDDGYKEGYKCGQREGEYHDAAFEEVRDLLGMTIDSDYKDAGKLVKELRTRAEQAERELEEARRKFSEWSDLWPEVVKLGPEGVKSNLELKARAERLEAALRKYGWHRGDCKMKRIRRGETEMLVGGCTCGFNAAIDKIDRAALEEE